MMNRSTLWSLGTALLAVALFSFNAGCSSPATSEPTTEKSTTEQGGGTEKPTTDKGQDAGPADTGPADSGPADNGPADTGTPDQGTPDQGTPDQGTPDQGGTEKPADTAKDAGPADTEEIPLPEIDPELPPEGTGPTSQGSAFIINSDFSKGSYTVLDVKTRTVTRPEGGTISGDTFGKVIGIGSQQGIAVLNRYNSSSKKDTALLINTQNWSQQITVTLSEKSNPHDIFVKSLSKTYIAQYGKKDLLVVNPTNGQVAKRIDLSALTEKSTKACTADKDCKGSGKCDTNTKMCQSDGTPEMTRMIHVNNKLYVLVQGLDRNDGFKPIKSAIAVIDTTTDTYVKKIDLKGKNPVAFVPEQGGTYLVVTVGSAFDATDGGLERFDPTTETMGGNFLLTEKAVGGSFPYGGEVVMTSKTQGYMLITDKSYKALLIQFDLSTGQKTKTILNAGSYGGLALTPAGELIVGNKAPKALGLRFFNASTGAELMRTPVSVGKLPPVQILLLP